MNTLTLNPCEECQGTGETIIEKHNCDCPHCLGTGLEQPQKRIMQLERELAEARDQCCQAINDYETAVLREHRMQEQRDAYEAALREIMINKEGLHRMGYNAYLIARAALKGGSHE